MEWTLDEHTGYDWPDELVWRELHERPEPDALEIVEEDGTVRPAQIDPNANRIAYVTSLPAGSRKRFALRAARSKHDCGFRLAIADGVAEIVNAGFGLRLRWNDAPDSDGGPLLGIRGVDGIWFGGSSFTSRTPATLATCPL